MDNKKGKASVLKENKQVFLIVFSMLLLLLTVVYITIFFSKGIIFNDSFLKKSQGISTTTYAGDTAGGYVEISVKSVKGGYEVAFDVPNNNPRSYSVALGKMEDYWQSITITRSNGEVVFDGLYQKDNSFLCDKNKKPVAMVSETYTSEEEFKNFTPNYHEMMMIANGSKDRIHGNIWLLLSAGALAFVWAYDVYTKKIFKTAEYIIFGRRNREHHKKFLLAQRITWIALPVLILILIILSV